MIVVHQENNVYILNIERGEELLSSLRAFLEKENIKAGYFSGLGAAGALDIAYYNLESKKFERHTIKEDVEILSLTGNIAMLKDERIIHCKILLILFQEYLKLRFSIFTINFLNL